MTEPTTTPQPQQQVTQVIYILTDTQKVAFNVMMPELPVFVVTLVTVMMVVLGALAMLHVLSMSGVQLELDTIKVSLLGLKVYGTVR